MVFAIIGGVLISVTSVGNTALWGGDDTGQAVLKGLQLMLSIVLFCMA